MKTVLLFFPRDINGLRTHFMVAITSVHVAFNFCGGSSSKRGAHGALTVFGWLVLIFYERIVLLTG